MARVNLQRQRKSVGVNSRETAAWFYLTHTYLNPLNQMDRACCIINWPRKWHAHRSRKSRVSQKRGRDREGRVTGQGGRPEVLDRLSVLRGTFAVGFLGAVAEPMSTCVSRYPGNVSFVWGRRVLRFTMAEGTWAPTGACEPSLKLTAIEKGFLSRSIPLSPLCLPPSKRHPLSHPLISVSSLASRIAPSCASLHRDSGANRPYPSRRHANF